MLEIFHVVCFLDYQIVSAKCSPSGLITKVTLFSIDEKAMKGANNQGKKAGFSVSKVIQT